MAAEKRSLNSLPALPLKRYSFTLTESEFRDGLSIRCNIEAKNTPINCPCGEKLKLLLDLHCAKDGCTHVGHKEIRDTFDKMMHNVCYDVEVESILQLLQSESFIHKTIRTDENARLDIKAMGVQIQLLFLRSSRSLTHSPSPETNSVKHTNVTSR